MNTPLHELWIKLKKQLNQEDYNLIQSLQLHCSNEEQISLKLELDYKLNDTLSTTNNTTIHEINEFMCFSDEQLVGYMGICSFGGATSPMEVTGMVHPNHRRKGIFSKLLELAVSECRKRNAGEILLLCDRKSTSGQRFLEKLGAKHKFSEFEMYLHDEYNSINNNKQTSIILRKATNTDAFEIARQDAIYFGNDFDVENENIILPEDEEMRGMTIYLAEKNNKIIGKVNLQLSHELGAIYGLGVLPEYRGQGFGRAVLSSAIEKLKDVNVSEIMLQVEAENATALNLYKSCGFYEASVMDYFELK